MRTLDQVNTDYTTKCAQLGDKNYKKLLLETEINSLVVEINALDKEAMDLKKKSVPTENTILTEDAVVVS